MNLISLCPRQRTSLTVSRLSSEDGRTTDVMKGVLELEVSGKSKFFMVRLPVKRLGVS